MLWGNWCLKSELMAIEGVNVHEVNGRALAHAVISTGSVGCRVSVLTAALA